MWYKGLVLYHKWLYVKWARIQNGIKGKREKFRVRFDATINTNSDNPMHHDISQVIAQANESIYGMSSFNLMNPSMNLCQTYHSSLQCGPQLPQFIRPPAQFIPNQQMQNNLQTNMSTNMTNQSNPPLVAFDMLMTTLSTLNQKFDNFQQQTSQQLSKLHVLDSINHRLTSLEGRLSDIKHDIQSMKNKIHCTWT